ncbi:hypothetical protein HYG86_09280 [Alkalicella caledoniensis]|uniref:Uncharacterized protein n=1 Tax=Alkalicella caledoniensis TaxID=2731377 RepID=A0A7G9W8E1_ALKCA|nr:hypothetical protein [Alkalicella caledoniensis]QNO14953.1 hypothetical protein HYG86_09280 [Alkalicella caledoniensis]
MKFYYFNNNTDNKGKHEVHTEDCSFLPATINRSYIGFHSNCKDAITNAKRANPAKSFDGCYWCSTQCHTG